MSCTSFDELVGIFKSITNNKKCDVSSIYCTEEKLIVLSEKICQQYGASSLEFEFSESLLSLVGMAKMAPPDYKLSYWLEYAVPNVELSLKQKLNVIVEGFFSFAI
ncbi:hypothetical protein [Alteromonas gracilis]|uniref:hypothetical protein n=1 Tax=Alteromonas gracilis TaxID=1479524 RepID=UPI0037367A77